MGEEEFDEESEFDLEESFTTGNIPLEVPNEISYDISPEEAEQMEADHKREQEQEFLQELREEEYRIWFESIQDDLRVDFLKENGIDDNEVREEYIKQNHEKEFDEFCKAEFRSTQ